MTDRTLQAIENPRHRALLVGYVARWSSRALRSEGLAESGIATSRVSAHTDAIEADLRELDGGDSINDEALDLPRSHPDFVRGLTSVWPELIWLVETIDTRRGEIAQLQASAGSKELSRV